MHRTNILGSEPLLNTVEHNPDNHSALAELFRYAFTNIDSFRVVAGVGVALDEKAMKVLESAEEGVAPPSVELEAAAREFHRYFNA